MKGGSGSLGEREEEMALLQPRKTLLLKTADKIGAGYCFCLGDCSLSSASLGSTPGVQTSSGRMSRPALRLTCFLSVCLPETPAPRKTLSSHRLTFLFPLQIWLTCLRLKIGKRKKGECIASFLPKSSLL